MRAFRPLALYLAFAAAPAFAQVYPTRSETPVTDDADLIPPVQEAELAQRIEQLRQQTGAEVAVVTLLSSALYTQGEDLGDYAAALSEEWGLGAQTGGQSVLIVVLRDDRELVIDLGDAYGEADLAAATAIRTDVIGPAFAADDYPRGLTEGVEAIATRILAPAPAPAAPAPSTPAEGEGSGGMWWLLALLGVPVAGVVAMNRRNAAKLAATPCPSCGKTGLERRRVTLVEATEATAGRGETRTSCPSCGYVTAVPFTIPKKSPPAKTAGGGKGKGGGTTSGGF